MRKPLFLFLFTLLTLFTVSTMMTSALTFKQNTNSTLTVSCDLINCSDGDVLITIVDPNGYLVIDNDTTTVNTGYVSYVINGTSINTTGAYPFYLSSDTDNYPDVFKVTPNGEDPSTANAFFYIGLLFILVIFLILTLVGFNNAEQIWSTCAFLGMAYVLLIAISFVAWNMALNYLTSAPFLIFVFRYTFIILEIGIFPFLIGLFAYGVYMALQIKEIKDLEGKGYTTEEALERSQFKGRRI